MPEAEEILDPWRPICDAHHHLWNLPSQCYLEAEFLADTGSGHRIVSSVYVEWRSHYLQIGPAEMRPVGETMFAADIAERTKNKPTHIGAAIVGFADLAAKAAVAPVLQAHIAAGKNYFRGIRHVGTWDADERVRGGGAIAPEGLYRDRRFREGLSELQPLGLSFDAWVYQTQLGDLIDLLEHLPDLPVVLNHTGGVLGIGPYAGHVDALFAAWRADMRILSSFPKLMLKLGGLGMARTGLSFHRRSISSSEISVAWQPWIETAIEFFGADRCMFESNYPADAGSCSYAVIWNAFKRLTEGASPADKDALFHDTACKFYRI